MKQIKTEQRAVQPSAPGLMFGALKTRVIFS
jgi:hypothetical protein